MNKIKNIRNKSQKAIANTCAVDNDAQEVHTRLVRADILFIDTQTVLSVVEWVSRWQDTDGEWHEETTSPSGSFSQRNCIILNEEEILPSDKPFKINTFKMEKIKLSGPTGGFGYVRKLSDEDIQTAYYQTINKGTKEEDNVLSLTKLSPTGQIIV